MYKYRQITRKIIKGYYLVYNELGTGFLESVYENALSKVLKEFGLEVERQIPIDVYFQGEIIGKFKADLVINGKIIVEVKAVKMVLPIHKAQIINYLKATNLEIGLLMNFGDSPEFKRYIFDRKRN